MCTLKVMATQEEFVSFLRSERQQQETGDGRGGKGDGGGWANVRTKQHKNSPTRSRPPHAPKFGEPPKLQSMPPSSSPPARRIESLPSQLIVSSARDHFRSLSDCNYGVPQSDPTHPFNKAVAPIPSPTISTHRSKLPPRAATPPRQFVAALPFEGTSNIKVSHRRAMSDPRAMDSGGSLGGGRLITKSDLLKKLPSPRWSGAPPKPIVYNRFRTGSDGPLLSIEIRSESSGAGYGATSDSANYHQSPSKLQSIGSFDYAINSSRHQRNRSDASAISVTTDMAKSALFKGVTETGRIQLQLPKDGFRLLMDSQLEAGYVYKRKLVDDEDEIFVEFHTVDEDDLVIGYGCCNRCREKNKRLPPDLYVMAVDSTIYRRMFDEVIASKAMPCGTFFCGHHADVRQPDITIAVLIVGVVFVLLLAGSIIMKD